MTSLSPQLIWTVKHPNTLNDRILLIPGKSGRLRMLDQDRNIDDGSPEAFG